MAVIVGTLWVIALALVVVYATQRSPTGTFAAGTKSPEVIAGGEQAAPSTVEDAIGGPASTLVSDPSMTTLDAPPDASATTEPPTTQAPPSSTTSTTEKPVPSVTVAAGGDVQGDRLVGTYIDSHGGSAALAKVAPYLRSADIAFINLEGPVSDKGTKFAWKEYTFRSRLALIDGLASAGVDVVSMANNHAVDCGQTALLDTISRLDKAGIEHAGAGEDIAVARSPALLQTTGGTVAVLAFTDKYAGGFAAGSEHPGVAPIGDGSKVIAAIKAAKKEADFVVVSFHWGTEYESRAAAYQRALAHKAVDAGADLILGHHPHVIQGLEIYHDRLIAYSLGDFVFDHRSRATGEAFVLRVTLRPSGPPVARIIPVYLSDANGIPAPVTGSAADTILDRLTRLSASLGLTLTRSGAQAWVDAGSDGN